MPAPITHIVLADKVFDKYFSGQDRKDFFIGTSFPDIRYYDNLDREKTHQGGLGLEEIAKESSFSAGAHFHALVDEKWNGFYRQLKDHPLYLEPRRVSETAFKFFEDERLYGRFKGWDVVAGFFGGALEEEKRFGIAEADIVRWHDCLRQYFIKNPDNETRQLIVADDIFSPDLVDQLNLFIERMRSDERIIKAVDEFYDKFESLL